jgi:YgiT-type zinc finger domain-containing protein
MFCRDPETKPGEPMVVLERGITTVVVKGVPAEVCANCGEAYGAEDVSERVLEVAEGMAARGVEVEVVRYAAGGPLPLPQFTCVLGSSFLGAVLGPDLISADRLFQEHRSFDETQAPAPLRSD